jgi:hypothetical protein
MALQAAALLLPLRPQEGGQGHAVPQRFLPKGWLLLVLRCIAQTVVE